jgi:hypothetical protein
MSEKAKPHMSEKAKQEYEQFILHLIKNKDAGGHN